MEKRGVISVLIKPTDSCNLRCKYCYHSCEGYNKDILDLKTLEKFYNLCCKHYKKVNVIWHGGEPTCVGIKYIQEALDLQKSIAKENGTVFTNSMQTNGTLLTEEWVKLLKKYKLSLGISYDGLTNSLTRGSTEKVVENMLMLKNNGIKFGTICVVSSYNVNKLLENYLYFNTLRIPVKFNHYIEVSSCSNELNIDVNIYVDEMFKLFVYWLNDAGCNIRVNPFTLYVKEYLFKKSNICCHQSCLRCWIGLNPNGDIAPCSRYYPGKYIYGNIKNMKDIKEIYSSDGFFNILKGSVIRREKCKKECEFYNICQGGCNNSAIMEGSLEQNGGFTCLAYRLLFGKIVKYLQDNEIDKLNFDKKIKNKLLVKTLRMV